MVYLIDKNIPANDVQTMAQVFFQHSSFRLCEAIPKEGLALQVCADAGCILAMLFNDGLAIESSRVFCCFSGVQAISIAVKTSVYECLARYTRYRPAWGILTGIRPTKIAHQLMSAGHNEHEAAKIFERLYFTDHEKAALCVEIAKNQQGILKGSRRDSVSLYVGVPFCPSRCLYCSFASYPSTKYGGMMGDYVSALILELAAVREMIGKRYIENIYVGGGTPTALDDTRFQHLLDAIATLFDTAGVIEYTIEAGRPDTITPTKLQIMRNHGATRLTINPQTLNNTTLAGIGRGHTAADFMQAWGMAQNAGFDHISADLILGLPQEGNGDVEKTLDGVLALNPASITVHTLAVKRASRLKDEITYHGIHQAQEMEAMISLTNARLSSSELLPYYMYRQKNSPGNFENVGWCKPGRHGLYNIQIMEEQQSIFAAGAGAVSKFVDKKSNLIRRAFNLKDLAGYIGRVDEMIERKKALL